MSFFRKRKDGASHVPEEGSYEEAESNPELLAAEEAVKNLPPPPPSSNPLRDVYMGTPPQFVSGPDESGDDAESADEDSE